jgi:alpha-amylase
LDCLDPNFGTEKDLKELVEKAHKQGIRIVLDAVINHTGPTTNLDETYPYDLGKNRTTMQIQ